MAVRNEAEAQETFERRYAAELLAGRTLLEREVLDTDHGANGYTTRDQADQLARALAVGPGDLLLDLGAGCGWPGLHVSAVTGCNAVISDLTLSGMRRAQERARADGIAGRIQAVAASARKLPFRPESFDAMVHTDVLC